MSAPWAISSFPATGAAPSAAQPATNNAGLINRLMAMQVGVAAGSTAQTPIGVTVSDGATVIWEGSVAAPANSVGTIPCDGPLDLRASAGNALTVAFVGTLQSGVQGFVNAQGDLIPPGKAYGQLS